MVRTVPYGLEKDQIIRPLIPSIMTNNLTAKAKVRYRVVACYPGGVIIDPVDDLLEPRGLLRQGVPIHVEGEPEPTEEELAPFVVSGLLPSVPSSKEAANVDVADLVEKKPPQRASSSTGAYEIHPERRVAAPKQAATICDLLIASGRASMLEWEIIGTLAQGKAQLNSKQDVKTVFKYYRPKFLESGFLTK